MVLRVNTNNLAAKGVHLSGKQIFPSKMFFYNENPYFKGFPEALMIFRKKG